MIDIHSNWRYVRNGNECFSVFAGNDFICETETEEAAKLICNLPELYGMLKDFIDPDLNPDFDYRSAEKILEHIEWLCRYESNQEAQS